MDDDVIDWLNQHEYFQGLSGAILGEIASFAKVTNYDAAAVLLQPNDPLTSDILAVVCLAVGEPE
jgi:hypothetical protein